MLSAALLLAGGVLGAGSASAFDGAPVSALCIPILLPCASPSPSPSPSPDPAVSSSPPSVPGVPGIPVVPSPAPSSSPTPVPVEPGADEPSPAPGSTTPAAEPAVPDAGAPVFTQPSAQLGAQALSFRGLPLVSVVTVPLADGSRITALKLSADEITIDGFALTVRRATGPALVTTADRMTLSGHVSVYLNSLTATTSDGKTLTLGADTPPPADGIAPGLARLTLGLVGATADAITYTNTDQEITQPG